MCLVEWLRFYAEIGRLPAVARFLRPFPLGTAISGASKAREGIACVLYDRIARVAALRQIPVVRALGYVMAHEVCHLLIGGSSHADKGLMGANWDPRESRTQTFTTSQMRQTRLRFIATLG